jgi:acyl-CoA synthetase (AMP-forming)/AMP-acid ligase II
MMLLDMAVSGHGERPAFGGRGSAVTYQELFNLAGRGAHQIRTLGAERVVFIAPNRLAFPVALFAAAWAGVPFVPMNYRLGHAPMEALLKDQGKALVIAAGEAADPARRTGHSPVEPAAWLRDVVAEQDPDRQWNNDGDAIAVLLYTSGTTAAPKAAILRHRNLTSYVFGAVEFGSARESDAALVSVPPYHIAGVANILSNVYAGRRLVPLPTFTPEEWLRIVREEEITSALVVPTMLARMVEALGDAESADVPKLRSLAYGGARMPSRVLERALALFPTTDFVNAYGLTETSSTIAVLGPDDHRNAMTSSEPAIRARLGSAGRILPGVELEIRTEGGRPAKSGEVGDLWVRGEQVSGEYVGRESGLDGGGWFGTRDRGSIDTEGYLFIEGRADDTIIRGGENIAPAEIEDVILRYPGVVEAVVVGPPDDEWGQRLAAVVVAREGEVIEPADIIEWVRKALRSSKAPDEVVFWETLPKTDTGKIIRRQVLARLGSA